MEASNLTKELTHLTHRVSFLEEENRWLKSQLFGRSSEKRPQDIAVEQQRLFNEAEVLAAHAVTETIAIGAHQRKKTGSKNIPAGLPRVEIVHDLAEAEKICPHDGTALVRIGEECSEQFHFIPAVVEVLKHIRYKYGCPCCRQGVKIAPVPAHILPKSKASASLLAHIVTAKYVDALPLHRQEAQFARLGVDLPRATMASWMVKLGEAVVPIINLMNEQLLESALIQMDETRVQVLSSDKAPTAEHWIWVRASGPPHRRIILFDYDPSRGGTVPMRLLEGFCGILQTDGYEAYCAVADAKGLIHAGCHAHARRRFEDARKAQADPSREGQSKVALDLIGQLYRIERDLKTASSEERLAVRRTQSVLIVQELKAWLDSMAEQVLPQSALGKAVFYTLGQWNKLRQFLDHPEIPLDTNRVENAIRPFCIGRKNWLFSQTTAGATASARLYSLVESAKANGVEPHAYLSRLFAELPKATSADHFESLLPWNITITKRCSPDEDLKSAMRGADRLSSERS
jgi:transposase